MFRIIIHVIKSLIKSIYPAIKHYFVDEVDKEYEYWKRRHVYEIIPFNKWKK